MPEAISTHLLALAVLLSRAADIGSTYLVTPNLDLETNDLVRRFRWRFALATLGLAGLPYLDAGLGVIVLVASLLVSASNVRSAWVVRALGEAEYLDFLRAAAGRSSRRAVYASVLISAAFSALAGLVLLFFYPTPSWGWYFAFGMIAYALAVAVHGFRFAHRLLETAGRRC